MKTPKTEETTTPAPENKSENQESEILKVKIEESKAAIQKAAQIDAPTVKRGPGRPPKKPQAPPVAPPIVEPIESLSTTPAPNIAPLIKSPIQMISKLPAVKYQIPELAFSDDEAEACAESLNQVIQAFVPDVGKMDPKTAAVIGAVSVFGSIGFQKYMIFKEKARPLKNPESGPEIQEKVAEAQQEANLHAGEYFKRDIAI